MPATENGGKTALYVGTYTRGDSVGIYLLHFDPETGRITFSGHAAKCRNPSFLAVHPNRRFLYAVHEMGGRAPNGEGRVSAWKIARKTGELTQVNEESAHGNSPCHITLAAKARYAIVSNYNSGSVCVLPIRADGSLGPATDLVRHHGKGTVRDRQAGPHVHSTLADDAAACVFAADLGIDAVAVYRLDPARGRLAPARTPQMKVHAGAGPRHMAMSPDRRFLYVANELDSTITVAERSADACTPAVRSTVSMLPASFRGTSYAADIHLHPCGRFLYASNRGHDSIAMFRVEDGGGRLVPLGHEPTGGRWPRNFAIAPDGRFLVVANQETFDIAAFRIDPETGRLHPTGHPAAVPFPVCLRFVNLG